MTTTVITEPLARATRQQLPLLSVTALSARALGRSELHDVTFELGESRVHGVYAAAGAGASTLAAVIAAELAPTAGSITVTGTVAPTAHELLRAGVVVIGRRGALLPARSVAANIFLAREPRWCGLIDVPAMRADATALLEALGMPLDPDARVAVLSSAEKRLVEVARASASGARLIVVDECGSEPDPVLGAALAVLADGGAAVLRISDDIAELAAACDSVSSL